MSQGNIDPAAACQLCCDLSAHLNYASSAAILLLSYNLSTQVQIVSLVVYNQLICDLSALAAMCQLSSNADSQLGCNSFNQPQSVSSTANCQLNCTLSTRVQSVSQSVYNQLLCRLSAPGGVCQLISNAECLLGCSLAAQLQFVSSAQFPVVNSILSSRAVCQLSCKLSTQLSAQVQVVSSAALC